MIYAFFLIHLISIYYLPGTVNKDVKSIPYTSKNGPCTHGACRSRGRDKMVKMNQCRKIKKCRKRWPMYNQATKEEFSLKLSEKNIERCYLFLKYYRFTMFHHYKMNAVSQKMDSSISKSSPHGRQTGFTQSCLVVKV